MAEEDLYHLAEELLMDVGDLLPIVKAVPGSTPLTAIGSREYPSKAPWSGFTWHQWEPVPDQGLGFCTNRNSALR